MSQTLWFIFFVCFHWYYLHFCISLYTCANVICIKLLLTYLLTYYLPTSSNAYVRKISTPPKLTSGHDVSLYVNFISPNVVASVKQKYVKKTDRGRQLQTVSRKQANIQTRQLQLLLRRKKDGQQDCPTCKVHELHL